MFQQESIPALYKGDRNSDACYGELATAGDINDIMGGGSVFGIENAQPWLNRFPVHLNLNATESAIFAASLPRWKVSKTEVPPKYIAKPGS